MLSEVRDAPRTLKLAAPLAVSTVTVLYVLANIAYVSRSLDSVYLVLGLITWSSSQLYPKANWQTQKLLLQPHFSNM